MREICAVLRNKSCPQIQYALGHGLIENPHQGKGKLGFFGITGSLNRDFYSTQAYFQGCQRSY